MAAPSTCTFCEVVVGSVPADIVARDESAVVFLDHRPIFPGHCLVVPVRHVPTLPDLTDAELVPYMRCVRRVTSVMPHVLGAEGTFVAANNIVSQSVPHLHFHVVPRRRKDGLRGFFWPRHGYENEAQRTEVASLLRSALAAVP
ncbi:MAG: HIT family protein [Acidimicrobiia bacterium]|nr:HIT family protein [Acidimicrobiia bacterium]